MHYPRETFEFTSPCKLVNPYIRVDVLGIGWPETWEAAIGFLSDPSISYGHFSEYQLQILKRVVEERLDQIANSKDVRWR